MPAMNLFQSSSSMTSSTRAMSSLRSLVTIKVTSSSKDYIIALLFFFHKSQNFYALFPFSGTPPVHPPTTTTTTTNNNVNNMKHPNGHTYPSPHHQQHQHPDDIVMADTDSQLAHTPGISQDFSMASIDTNYNSQQSTTRSYPDDNDDQREPPAKRARVHSDADMASTAHVSKPCSSVRQYGRAN